MLANTVVFAEVGTSRGCAMKLEACLNDKQKESCTHVLFSSQH